MARRELARLHLGAAQCRAARASRRPHALPARPDRARAMAGAFRAGGWRRPDRRLLRHRGGAHCRARRDAAAHRPRPPASFAAAAQRGVGPLRRLALRPGEPPPGERLPVDRRALQRQRLAPIPPIAGAGRLGRLRRDGPRAGQGGLAHARPLHRVCRAQRDRRYDRGSDPHARRGQRALGHRLDRIPGARSGPQALRRQADHQLDQFRGRRRGGRQAPGSCAPLRHGRHRPDDRRDRDGEGGRAQIAGGAAPLRLRLRQARPAAFGFAVRPADLHDLHRQRGRPQARLVDIGGDRADLARHARMPNHSWPVEHLVRPQPAGAPRPQLGLSRPCAAPRPHRRNRAFLAHRAVAQDPGGRGAGRRGSDLRQAARGLRSRCRPISRCSKTARPRRPRRRAARTSSRTASHSASSTATGSIWKPTSTWRCRITSRSTSSTTFCSAA